MSRLAAAFAVFGLILVAAVPADAFDIQEVASLDGFDLARLKPGVIAFADRPDKALDDSDSGLMKFEDWARARPLQKQLLALYPGYVEPTVDLTIAGLHKQVREHLHVYVAQARLTLPRAPASIDLNRYVDLAFVKRIDPQIEYRRIGPDDTEVGKTPRTVANKLEGRRWCEGRAHAICLHARYRFEGKLPLGIRLANKLRDSDKQIAEYLEFDSELAALSETEMQSLPLAQLTGVPGPVVGALEQDIFYVNQVIQFGKLLAVLQAHPSDPGRSVVSVYVALALDSGILGKKKEFAQVPVLRNMVPIQVLAGKSSFNTGNSISAGLPVYARNRIKAIAEQLQAPSQ